MKMRATQNFAYGTKRGEQWMAGGDVLDEDDPIVKAFPAFFEPVYETVSNPAPAAPAPAPEKPPARRRRNG